MQVKITSKNKTNKHTFFWARQELTMVLRISVRNRKSGFT